MPAVGGYRTKKNKGSKYSLSSAKWTWPWVILGFANICLNIDRIGRVFNAVEIAQIVVTAARYVELAFYTYFTIQREILWLLTGTLL